MKKQFSNTLIRLRELTKNEYKRLISAKSEKEVSKLLFLYVNNCPSSNGPEKAKGFIDYGIKSGYEYSKLKKMIISKLALKKDVTYKYCKNGNEMESLIDEIETIYSSRRRAIIFFSKGSHGEMDSLFIRIRNSFAHGNYFKIKDYYYLWNETGTGTKKLGSFMTLKYEDLIEIHSALSNAMQKF